MIRPEHPQQTLYDMLGEEKFRELVAAFYEEIKVDDLIGPMYPKDDMAGAEDRLRWFLVQYWGGPAEFSAKRGHPRLRLRHARFDISMAEADRWLELMDRAMDKVELRDPIRGAMRQHMEQVAAMLINRAP